ncbi:MAG: hypothetical protein ABI904_07040 [Chloroflexota bacterium]
MAKGKNLHGKISRIGQLIGGAFEIAVHEHIKAYLKIKHPEYEILLPLKGRKEITLEMLGGDARQVDSVIVQKDFVDPIALLETKWLKDGRHWNDKGAWILQLREVRKNYPTVRGIAAVLAGFWNHGVRIFLSNEGGVQMILIATDDDIYNSIQPFLDEELEEETFKLDAENIRERFPEEHVENFYDFLNEFKKSGKLDKLAETWLNFKKIDDKGTTVKGKNLIEVSIDKILMPIPKHPKISNYEITLEIETGNLIYRKFDDMEELLEFINEYTGNPDKIYDDIKPKNKGRVGEQMSFYDTETKDET